jgi:8-oxo-dGTP pyrophosphatase MutT (NUDIX family)
VKRPKTVGIQYAALPYRLVGRRVEILLITSRETRRWVIPKGWPMQRLRPQDAAATEAFEEAGITGAVEDKPIGSYRYMKKLKADAVVAVQVIVFPLLVEQQVETWKEQGQREASWFRYQRASTLVAELSLRRLIRDFGKARTPGVLPAGMLDHRAVRWSRSLFWPQR